MRILGSLDASDAAELEAALTRSGCCVVDCRGVTAIDAAVLRVLVAAHEVVEERGNHLIFLGLHGGPLDQVRLRCLDEILHLA